MLKFDHDNLVSLIGVSIQQKPWLCVISYMNVCTLRARTRCDISPLICHISMEILETCSRLAKKKVCLGVITVWLTHVTAYNLGFHEQLHLAKQIGEGMKYMASLRFIHMYVWVCLCA